MADSERLVITKPSRSHKSKKDQQRKTTTRIIQGGFVERVRRPLQQGTNVKSQLMRVDGDFAEWLRGEAMRSGNSITDITRHIFYSLVEESEK